MELWPPHKKFHIEVQKPFRSQKFRNTSCSAVIYDRLGSVCIWYICQLKDRTGSKSSLYDNNFFFAQSILTKYSMKQRSRILHICKVWNVQRNWFRVLERNVTVRATYWTCLDLILFFTVQDVAHTQLRVPTVVLKMMAASMFSDFSLLHKFDITSKYRLA